MLLTILDNNVLKKKRQEKKVCATRNNDEFYWKSRLLPLRLDKYPVNIEAVFVINCLSMDTLVLELLESYSLEKIFNIL